MTVGNEAVVRTSTAELVAQREQRRDRIRLKRVHHHALRTDDMEATRHFYEDILEMPLVSTLVLEVDPTRGKNTPYLHCFFEMADGGMMAFFEFANNARGPAPKTPQDALDHHIALSVPNFDDIKYLKAKLEAAGHRCAGIDHDFCYSLYVRDPNGLLLEFLGDPDNELEINEGFVATARGNLERWNNGDYSDSLDKSTIKNHTFPIDPSPLAEVLKVLADDRELFQ